MTPQQQSIRQLVADVLNVPAVDVTRDSSPDTIETWDSVAHLSIVLAIEQEFGITFNLEEVENLHTVGALMDAAERYTSHGS